MESNEDEFICLFIRGLWLQNGPVLVQFWSSSGPVLVQFRADSSQSRPQLLCGRSARAELRHPADARRWADMVEGIMGKVCTAVGGVGLVVVMLIITE